MSTLNSDENKTSQYLTFTLRDGDFAIDIAKVREVLDITTMTKLPRMPSYISGVINLRGNVVPVLDLGCRLGMEPVVQTKNTCVMIMETTIDKTIVSIGTVADSVQMVLDLQTSEIEEVPRIGRNINTDFINGMGKQGEKFLVILNIDKVLSQDAEELLSHLDLDTAMFCEPAAEHPESAGAAN